MQKARVKGGWGTNAVITDKGEIIEPRMLGDGLRPSAVTRDLKWGVEVPKVGDKEEDDAMEGKVICESNRVASIPQLTVRRLVRCADWLPVNHRYLHRPMAKVVDEPRQCRAVPVHGQGQ